MAQKLVNTQVQEQQLAQVQQQRLNAQQVMYVRMLEMPLTQYEEYVKTEIDENPALEPDIQENSDSTDSYEGGEETGNSNEDIDAAIDRYDDDRYDDDYVPTASASYATSDKDGNETPVWGNSESFYDTLHSQMGEQDLTERQELIMDYIIGSLDSDGLFRKDITNLSDEIAIHEYIDVSPEEIEKVLTILQGFDPAGIGAQNLQQCLLIQIFRKKATPLTKLMYQVISDYYEDFTRKHWKKIEEQMQMDSITAEKVFGEIRKLNPRPGAALGETMGRNTQHVTPDFIVTVGEDGEIYFSMPKGRIPQLHVSQDFENMIQGYRQNPNSMTRSDKEALLYAQQKVSKAKAYIDAMKQRQQTMALTMKTIISLQRKFILSGDESDLVPMKLKDIADRTNMDMSTVSRVCASKYAEMPWGIIQLKSFFSEGYDTGDGETVSTKEIRKALKELIDNEPQGKPLSDIRLAAELKKMGYPIARRTVTKYREKMGIPTSNLRR